MRDNPRDWSDSYCPPPPNFDAEAYQRQIDEITGTPSGHSIIKIFWGASESEMTATSITNLGTVGSLAEVGTFRTRVKGISGKVRIRRWIFCEWQPPEQIHQDTFVRLPEAAGLYVPPKLVEERRVGAWLKWYPACDHSNCLLENCNSTDYFCFGDYREPDITDLHRIMRISTKNKANPFHAVTQEQVDQWFKEADDEVANIEMMEREQAMQEHRENARIMARTSVSG